jgi:hypothetical protein
MGGDKSAGRMALLRLQWASNAAILRRAGKGLHETANSCQLARQSGAKR